MTEATTHPPRARWHAALTGSGVSRSRSLLWMFFLAVHVWLVYLNLFPAAYGLNDVTYVYKQWMEQGVYANYWPGISGVWVYPIAAIVPMFVATIFGFSSYGTTWLLLVTVLDGVALAALTRWGRPNSSLALGWWWLAFVLLLGPIALGRIDSVTIPLALVAVMMIATRPGLAAVLLTVGTWMKIWPVAILAAMVIVLRERGRVVSGAILTSTVIVALALAFGSGSNVLSFITEQTGRGLQIEAPVTTFWMWQAFAGVPGVSVYYDTDILTYQASGGSAATAAALMTPLLVVVVGALCLLGMLALRRGTSAAQILPTLALALVVALIAFNKVGSPQFMTWLSVPVVLGIATRMGGLGRSFRAPASLVLVMALLTQLVYPYFYTGVVTLQPLMLTVLSVRNALLFVVLAWAVTALVGMARRPAPSGTLTDHPTKVATTTPSSPPSISVSSPSTPTVSSTQRE
jgi:hypothetical protein